MTFRIAVLALLLLLAVACQTPRRDFGANPMENPEFMELMMANGTPGEPHQALAQTAGTWKATNKWKPTPDAEPMVSEATAERRMILGGRFLVEEYKSEFFGQPFEGMLLTGYDNATEEYVSLWIDNYGTQFHLSHGTENEAGEITFRGVIKDPQTPDGRPGRSVLIPMGPDKTKFQFYDTTVDGTEFMHMEIVYTRS